MSTAASGAAATATLTLTFTLTLAVGLDLDLDWNSSGRDCARIIDEAISLESVLLTGGTKLRSRCIALSHPIHHHLSHLTSPRLTTPQLISTQLNSSRLIVAFVFTTGQEIALLSDFANQKRPQGSGSPIIRADTRFNQLFAATQKPLD
ncbi:hypothetical protein F5883DRAFT_32866 [Diaporthe sp. PMI_573]|nr:hypothetical protein F5883DRAFT_32866 [Diaporthaceae sp. PMI_573]